MEVRDWLCPAVAFGFMTSLELCVSSCGLKKLNNASEVNKSGWLTFGFSQAQGLGLYNNDLSCCNLFENPGVDQMAKEKCEHYTGISLKSCNP